MSSNGILALIVLHISASAGLQCYDATSYDGNLPKNATIMTNCTSCATSRMEHILYTFVTYQWSCQRGPPNAPPVPESQCATMSMETADKARTYAQAMCQCCEDLCNKDPCRAWATPQPLCNCTATMLQTSCNSSTQDSSLTIILHPLTMIAMLVAALS